MALESRRAHGSLSPMAERPAWQALFDDGKRLGFVVAALSAFVCAVVWSWARELDSGVRGVVALSAAAAVVLLVLGITWVTRDYLGDAATRPDGVAARSLMQTLRDMSSHTAHGSTRAH